MENMWWKDFDQQPVMFYRAKCSLLCIQCCVPSIFRMILQWHLNKITNAWQTAFLNAFSRMESAQCCTLICPSLKLVPEGPVAIDLIHLVLVHVEVVMVNLWCNCNSVAYRYRKSISIIELFVSIYIGFLASWGQRARVKSIYRYIDLSSWYEFWFALICVDMNVISALYNAIQQFWDGFDSK